MYMYSSVHNLVQVCYWECPFIVSTSIVHILEISNHLSETEHVLYHGYNIMTNQIALLEVYKSLMHLL